MFLETEVKQSRGFKVETTLTEHLVPCVPCAVSTQGLNTENANLLPETGSMVNFVRIFNKQPNSFT